jgi:hypothetical protein
MNETRRILVFPRFFIGKNISNLSRFIEKTQKTNPLFYGDLGGNQGKLLIYGRVGSPDREDPDNPIVWV